MNDSVLCEQCGQTIVYIDHSVPPASFCGSTCTEAWEAATPGTWVAVKYLTLIQRAELDAILGHGAKA